LPREGYYFLLDQKVAKNQVCKEASLPHMPLPRKSVRTTGWNLLPYWRSLLPAHLQKSLCPCHPQATIVLPAFARSCFADMEEEKIL
jgi:hypothetical protein